MSKFTSKCKWTKYPKQSLGFSKHKTKSLISITVYIYAIYLDMRTQFESKSKENDSYTIDE